MITKLSVVEGDLLDFIELYTSCHRVPPTIEEMRSGLGYRSKSPVHRLLEALQDKGVIARRYNRNQAIEVLQPSRPRADSYYALLELARAMNAPIPGSIQTLPAFDNLSIRRGGTAASDTRSGGPNPSRTPPIRAGAQLSEAL